VVASIATATGAGTAQAADPSTLLPLGTYSHMAVDATQGLAFITGHAHQFSNRPGVSGVAVVNVDGSSPAVITGTSASTGVVVGPDGLVYAAEDDGHIAQIDPATKSLVHAFNTGNVCPNSIAFAGAELWFSYGCDPSTDAGLAELDTATSTITSGVLHGAHATRATLASVPGHTDKLVATNLSDVGGDLNVLTIAGVTATVAKTITGLNLADVAVNPDGNSVLVAGGSAARTYAISDLSDLGVTYNTPLGGSASVAYSADGTYVGVGTGPDPFNATVTTFGPSSTIPVRSYDTSTPGSANQGQNNLPQEADLAWSGTALLAVYVDYLGAYPKLVVYNSAIKALTAMTLTGPASSTRAAPLALHGTLTSGGAALAGVQLAVTKTDLDGAHTLPSVTTSGTGAFTVSNTPAVGGTNTYHVSYAGDATHAAVAKSIKVAVSRATTTLTIKTDHATYNYGQTMHAVAHLGGTFSNRVVNIYVTPYHAPRVLLRSAHVDSHGNLATSAIARTRSVWTASFAGDERWAPRTVTAVVKVHAKIVSKVGRKLGTSGKYGIFSASNGGSLTITVSPNKANENVRFVLQVYSGGWHTVLTKLYPLLSNSAKLIYFWGDRGYNYRIRGQYGGDAANLSQVGTWVYAQFH
jgi:hypothetical protein